MCTKQWRKALRRLPSQIEDNNGNESEIRREHLPNRMGILDCGAGNNT